MQFCLRQGELFMLLLCTAFLTRKKASLVYPAPQTGNSPTTYHCTSTQKHPAMPCGGCRPPKWFFHLHKFSVFDCTLEGDGGEGGGGEGPSLLLWCTDILILPSPKPIPRPLEGFWKRANFRKFVNASH